jgi:hypothetical protein
MKLRDKNFELPMSSDLDTYCIHQSAPSRCSGLIDSSSLSSAFFPT